MELDNIVINKIKFNTTTEELLNQYFDCWEEIKRELNPNDSMLIREELIKALINQSPNIDHTIYLVYNNKNASTNESL
ncbi:MAG: hypothetical protein FK734_15935 [Asgard group archaeon]|nr:hypothetical protein [Asgard group archaeon]